MTCLMPIGVRVRHISLLVEDSRGRIASSRGGDCPAGYKLWTDTTQAERDAIAGQIGATIGKLAVKLARVKMGPAGCGGAGQGELPL